jgi:ribonuclease P protein component
MLSKKNRISRKEIETLFRVGKSLSTSEILLKYVIEKDKNHKKVSFTVPKSLIKKSNKRNLLRRRGYIAIESELESLPKGFSGIFILIGRSLNNLTSRKTKKYNPVSILNLELREILNKI